MTEQQKDANNKSKKIIDDDGYEYEELLISIRLIPADYEAWLKETTNETNRTNYNNNPTTKSVHFHEQANN
jgi:hypothetical protein